MNDYRISIEASLRRFLNEKGLLLSFVANVEQQLREQPPECFDAPQPALPEMPTTVHITSIINAFAWQHTPEGFEYWRKQDNAFRNSRYRHHFRSKYPTK